MCSLKKLQDRYKYLGTKTTGQEEGYKCLLLRVQAMDFDLFSVNFCLLLAKILLNEDEAKQYKGL